ncbi:MAG: Fic family protein [Planctomycetota bacterium]|nr:Fic family protein [Planctomycetota bacterium]
MGFNPQQPYDDLPSLPPRADVETKAVLKQCVAASRALAELKGAGGLIPDQAILINAIPLQEAKLSSEIENIVTTQDDLFRAAVEESVDADPSTKEVLRYRTALHNGYEALPSQPFSIELVRETCRILRGQTVDFRSPSDHVRISDTRTRSVIYTPPSGGPALVEKLRNLESYLLAADGPDPLIRMAVAHYQFEAIHPFTDGNGRTGRILNILYLVHMGLLQIPVLYISRFIIQNKPDYYRLLREVTESDDWESWLLYMLRGVEETALWTTGRIQAIRELFDLTMDRCRTEAPKIYSKELIELIFRQPYCKISFIVDAGIAKRKTASEYLQELERIGVMVGEKHRRETIYKHPALLEVVQK